jgi:hypothetical protein
MIACVFRLIVTALLWFAPLAASAQSPQSGSAPTPPLLEEAELDQLLAPIALYPDPLLSETLIASTYPLEVVQADRWTKANTKLKGDALKAALAKQSWDESVKSLVSVPSVLSMMADQLDWTQKLGDAMLAQQADVMDSIQRLRHRAQDNGKLKSTKEQTVTIKTEGAKQYVVIEPTSPTEIYVPYYEPAVVYGDWPYPEYAPYYFPPPYGYLPGAALATGIAFATAVAVRHAYWGNCDWGRRNINVVANRSVDIGNINRGRWEHNADHRHGVRYNNADVRQKYAKTDIQAGKAARQDFRGKEGQKVLEPDRGRPASGDRDQPRAGERPTAGDRDRPGAGDGDRRAAGDRDRPQAGGRPDGGKGGAPKQSGGAKGGGPKASQRPSPKAGPKATQRPAPKPAQRNAARPSPAPRDTGFSHAQAGHAARGYASRGAQSLGGRGPQARGGARMGGGGGRRSDIALKSDIVLLGYLDNGLGFYRFRYIGTEQVYVGVLAQEVAAVMPDAVVRGPDGFLKVFYDKLGLRFQSYREWIVSGTRLPAVRP